MSKLVTIQISRRGIFELYLIKMKCSLFESKWKITFQMIKDMINPPKTEGALFG